VSVKALYARPANLNSRDNHNTKTVYSFICQRVTNCWDYVEQSQVWYNNCEWWNGSDVEERGGSMFCFIPSTDLKYSVDDPNYIRIKFLPNVSHASQAAPTCTGSDIVKTSCMYRPTLEMWHS
jgi:hypothetical protein